ncbi:MAG: glucosamine-6-phosphate deaminase [bacterium]
MKTHPVRRFFVDSLQVLVFADRAKMGRAAGQAVAEKMRVLLEKQNEVRMIFAAAPSQNEFLTELARTTQIDWARVTAFHMDEYLGLPGEAPQGFGRFLRERLFDKVPFKAVNYIRAAASDVQDECKRYAGLLREAAIDIVCLGIGENGHIAFNDPPVADFNDPEWVKVVELDERCRQQQVNDGCFAAIEDVPEQAITLTVPTLMSAEALFGVVPGPAKAQAVCHALSGPIDPVCPASILRRHQNAVLFLDVDSAAKLISTN